MKKCKKVSEKFSEPMKIFFIFVKISFIKNVNCFMQNFTCEFFHKVRGGTQNTSFVKYFFMKIFYIKIFTFFQL